MSLRRLSLRAAAVAGAAFVLPLHTLLAEEGGHAAETWLGIPRTFWLSANLIGFLALLGYFLVPPIKRFLEARAEEIKRNLEQAQVQQRESVAMREGLNARLAALEAEMQEMLQRARGEAERERQEILAQAERERERLLAQTREEIAHRLSQARHELTSYTAELAADLAREKVEREITPDDRKRLFEDNLRRLEGARR